MTQVTRPVLATLSAFGASLPTAVKNFRGHLYWKRANGSEDEIYAGVKDASNVNQLRRILTKTYGDTLYAPVGSKYIVQTADATLTNEQSLGALATGIVKNTTSTGVLSIAASGTDYDLLPVPAPIVGMTVDPTGVTNFGSNNTYAAYLGRANAAYTQVVLRFDVQTAAVAAITWAEVGIGTSAAITLGGAASITRRGYTDVSASFNSTGEKNVTVSVSGIAFGDHLWALCGSQAATQFQVLKGVGGHLSAGNYQNVNSTRISTMSSPTSFNVSIDPVNTIFACMWIGS